MGIRRTLLPFESDYVQIPNAWLRDEKLSRRARGLLAELMTHRAGWHITIASLQKTGPEGRDAIRSAVQELVSRGYLVRRQTQGESGRFNEIEYEISDPTGVGKSDTGGFSDDGSADDGSADVGGPATKKNISQNTITSEDHQGGAGALSPFCAKHSPHGPNGARCRACGDARMAFTAATQSRQTRPTLAPPSLAALRDNECPDHHGYPIINGRCDKCDQIRLEGAA